VRSSSLNRRATLSWPRRALVWRVSLHKQSAEKSLFPAPAPAMHALAPTHCTRTQTYTANLDSEMVKDDMQSNPLAPEGPDSVVEGSTLDPTYVSVQPPFHRIRSHPRQGRSARRCSVDTALHPSNASHSH
jgi:hypothetical protein